MRLVSSDITWHSSELANVYSSDLEAKLSLRTFSGFASPRLFISPAPLSGLPASVSLMQALHVGSTHRHGRSADAGLSRLFNSDIS